MLIPIADLPQEESAPELLLQLLTDRSYAWLLVAALGVTVLAHVGMAVAVYVHSGRARVEGLSRSRWVLLVLSSGLFAAIAYWILHVSAAKTDAGRRESADLDP